MIISSGCTETNPTKTSSQEKTPTDEVAKIAKVGFVGPDFRLKNLEGNPVTLRSLRGKVILINFWATWCAPCRFEMPSMEKMYQSLNRNDFEILAVSGDEDGLKSVKPFVSEFKLTFPILLDEPLEAHDLYAVRSIPTTLILDRKGIITNRFFGAMDWDEPAQRNLIVQLINSPT